MRTLEEMLAKSLITNQDQSVYDYNEANDIILKEIGIAAALEQLAEECAELGKAALKLARIERDDNPSLIGTDDAIDNLFEEYSDVLLVADVIGLLGSIDIIDYKQKRWLARINDHKRNI